MLVLVLLGIVAVLIDRGVVPLRLPSWHRQVDETWLDRYRGWVYGAGFGFQLGAAVFTRIPTAASHLTAVAAVLASAVAASPLPGVVIGVTFGAVRGLPLLLGAPLTRPGQAQRVPRTDGGRDPTRGPRHQHRRGGSALAVVAAAVVAD